MVDRNDVRLETTPPPSRLNPSLSVKQTFAVIGVLALLTPVSLLAYRGYTAYAQLRATRTTLLKIDELLHQRIDAFNRWIDSMNVDAPGRPEYVYDSDYALLAPLGVEPGDPKYSDVAMVIARKNRFRDLFPQDYSEVPANSDFPGPLSTPTWENAECLYHFIVHSSVSGVEPVEEGFFLSTEIGDVDGDGRKEFVDSWGNTIRYYRWPTRLVADAHAPQLMGSIVMTTPIDGADGQPGVAGVDDDGLGGIDDANERGWPGSDDPANDPDDPDRLIPDLLHQLAKLPTPAPYDFESNFHTPSTYHTPLLASAGPDGSSPREIDRNFLCLYEPINTGRYGHLAELEEKFIGDLADNITNLNSRVGGR